MNTAQRISFTCMTAAAMIALGACSKTDDRTAGQKVDAAIAKTEQTTEQVAADAKAAAERAKSAVSDGANRAGSAVENATDKVASKVGDAGITAGINAELAKDATLSALRINVDTSDGRVRLSGTAPSTEARQRATQLAQGVKGVQSVDNQLEVRS